MADESNELPLEVEVALETSQTSVKGEATLRRGLASLRGVRRTVYMRRSILRVASRASSSRAPLAARSTSTTRGRGAAPISTWP